MELRGLELSCISGSSRRPRQGNRDYFNPIAPIRAKRDEEDPQTTKVDDKFIFKHLLSLKGLRAVYFTR